MSDDKNLLNDPMVLRELIMDHYQYPHNHELTKEEGYVWGVIRTAMASVSDLCVVPMQDFLGLGEEGRMNFPGTMSDANWTWRATQEMFTDELAERIGKLVRLYNRAVK